MHISFHLLLWPFQLSCRLSYKIFLSLFMTNHNPYSFSFPTDHVPYSFPLTNITGTPAVSLYARHSGHLSSVRHFDHDYYYLCSRSGVCLTYSIYFILSYSRLRWPHLLVVFLFLLQRRGGALPFTFTFPLSLQECGGILPLTVTSLIFSVIPIPFVILLAPCSDIL